MTNDSEHSSTDDATLSIDRKLDLDVDADRRELVAACALLPKLRKLVEDQMGNYLKWFKAPEWHIVYSGGMMSGPEPRGKHARMGSSLERLLTITAKLELLQDFQGFNNLISGLENPSQIAATFFEIDVASWCTTLGAHRDIMFSPSVTKRTGIKYPDFLWQTALGSLYCECKQLNMWQRTETQRADTLMSLAAEKMGDPDLWPRDKRIEVLIHGRFRRDSEERLKTAVEQQASEVRRSLHPSRFSDDSFTVSVRDRSEAPLRLPDSVTVFQVQVGNVPVRLDDHQSAHLIVTRSTALARARALRDFVKEAKQQLPDEGPGGIFIEMPGGIDIAAQKLQEMLGNPAHHAVVWASIWTGGIPARAVWQNGQPFDARLIEPSSS
jgi:hypothetical protein